MHRLAWALLALSVSTPAMGHKLRVFASAEGNQITGSAYFAGGAGASGAQIRVLDEQGQTLAELNQDGNGRFSYKAQAAETLVVVAETGDGHRAEWRIPAAELAGAFPDQVSERTETAAPLRAGAAAQPSPQVAAPALTQGPGEIALEAAIERAVARQVRPLREELMAAQDQARLRDMLGGIGYILGITGLALWWRSRRQGQGA